MTTPRQSITDFSTQNAYYAGATVTLYEVDESLEVTETLATLYAGPTGDTLLSNPQTLDSRGAWPAPVYVDTPVVMEVTRGLDVRETGIVGAIPRWRGLWTTGTRYFIGDRFRSPGSMVNAVALTNHVAGTYSSDLAAERVEEEAVSASSIGVPLENYVAVDKTGATNMASLIASAAATAAAAGNAVLIGPGDYLASNMINLVDDAWVILAQGARIIRDCVTVGVTGLIGQASYDSPISRVRWQGGTIHNPDPATLTGRAFGLYMNDGVIEDVFIDEWSDLGTAGVVFGDRNRVRRLHAISQNDGGGFFFLGGDDNKAIDCHVECGDDVYAISCTGSASAPNFGLGAKRNQFINCTGRSYNAHLMLCGATNSGAASVTTDVDVEDNAFIGVRGRGRLAALITNDVSSGVVRRTHFTDCAVDCTDAAEGGSSAVTLYVANGSGGIEDTQATACTFLGGVISTVNIYGGPLRSRFTDCFIGAPTTTRETIRLEDGCTAYFRGCTIQARDDANGIRVGFGGGNTAKISVVDCSLLDIGNSLQGIRIYSCASAQIRGNRFMAASGATASRAIMVAEGCLNVIIGGDNDYADLGAGDKIVWPNTTQNSGCKIERAVAQVITTNTTAREYLSGTVYVLTGSTGRTLTLTAAGYGLEFGGVQSGTGALKIQAQAGETIKAGSLTSSAGGYIESGSAGATVRLVGLDGDTWQAIAISGTWTAA